MKTATIHYDHDCESPREWSNIGTLCLFHRRMNVPNESNLSAREVNTLVSDPDFDGYSLPVYCYEHGGISLSTRPFSCPWDSGQLGVIYVSRRTLRDEFGDMSEDAMKHRAGICLQSEVEVFGQWLNGECFGYVIKDEDGSDIDSCWGFLGYDTVVEAAKEAGASKIVGEIQA